MTVPITHIPHYSENNRIQSGRRKRKAGVIANTNDPTICLYDLKILAAKRGGSILEERYVNQYVPMKWKCKEGHEFEASLNRIHGGRWCPICPGKRKKRRARRISSPKNPSPKRKKKSTRNTERDSERRYRKFNAILADVKGNCLSHKFLGWGSEHEWVCECGNIFKLSPKRISKGEWCPACNPPDIEVGKPVAESKHERKKPDAPMKSQTIMKQKQKSDLPEPKISASTRSMRSMTPDQKLALMGEIAREKGGECLSSTYVNTDKKLKWRCSEGHVFYKAPHYVKSGESWCNKCKGIFDSYPDDIPPDPEPKALPNVCKVVREKADETDSRKTETPEVPETYSLFAFDLNNLTVRYREIFTDIPNSSPVEDLLLYIWHTTGTRVFKAWWFVSENHADGLRFLKDTSVHKAYIERHYKNARDRVYMDIDTTMCAKIAQILERDHDRIDHFYLGSGDKDFYYLLQLAREYSIPITVIGTQPRDVSRELKNHADNVSILF